MGGLDPVYNADQHAEKLTLPLKPIWSVFPGTTIVAPSIAYDPGHTALVTYMHAGELDPLLDQHSFPLGLPTMFVRTTTDGMCAVSTVMTAQCTHVLPLMQTLAQTVVPHPGIADVLYTSLIGPCSLSVGLM